MEHVQVNLLEGQKNILKEIIEFLEVEYERDYKDIDELIKEAYKSEFLIPIAYTTFAECEDIEINCYFDLSNLRLITKATGNNGLVLEEIEWYQDCEEAIEAINAYRFDELTVLDEETDWVTDKLLD